MGRITTRLDDRSNSVLDESDDKKAREVVKDMRRQIEGVRQEATVEDIRNLLLSDYTPVGAQGRQIEHCFGSGENKWRIVIETSGQRQGNNLYVSNCKFMVRKME